MPLPDLIEIVPLAQPVRAEITVPGSKSITNRALILAALAEGEVTLTGALWSEDTQIMTECLLELGFKVDVQPDPNEACNRIITVQGKGGVVPPGGTEQQPMELFVGNAGTAARFLAAFVCLGKGVYRLHGVPRMHERPQAALFKALRELGYRVEAANDKLPVIIFGGDASSLRSSRGNEAQTPPPEIDQSLLTSAATNERKCTVSIEQSSQFASALLLCAQTGGWSVEVAGENAEESPYVVMTSKMVEVFPKGGGTFQIEPDASSGSYFWGIGWLLENSESAGVMRRIAQDPNSDVQRKVTAEFIKHGRSRLRVAGWPDSGWQMDAEFTVFVASHVSSLAVEISRRHDLGDSIMTAIVLGPFASQAVNFTDLGRLRVQECERVIALRTELTKCGAKVVEEGDTLTVYPSPLHGAEIETYNDHRMAMCFAILGLKVPGIKIINPACVKKTFPNFFQKLAAAPPHGLGAEIWEIKDGQRTRKLNGNDLFAD